MRAGLRLVLLAFFVGGETALPADTERAPIRQADLERHLNFLASDTLEGREAGSSGGRAASIYLVDEARRLGLEPAGDKDLYTQEFAAAYRNVLACLPGTDADLRHEFLLVGAHYDHVGYGRRGNTYGPIGFIHNGADDNASGTAALLEIAELLAMQPERPRRTVLFAWWDAEEINLNGSEHWRAHPTRPLHGVRLVINVDMVGRLRDESVVVHGVRTAAALRELAAWANNDTRLLLDFRRQHVRDSDHYPFFQARVPYLAFDTGKHPDYHRPTDDVERLNLAGLEHVACFLGELVRSAADRESLPGFRPECIAEAGQSDPDPAGHQAAPPVRLGLSWHPRRIGEPVRIRAVDTGSPAERAGIRGGDTLEEFGGRPAALTPHLATLVAMSESPVGIVVSRAGLADRLHISVELRGKPSAGGYLAYQDPAEPGIDIVTRVLPGSPAHDSGLQTGDRVLKGIAAAAASAEQNDPLPGMLVVERRGRIERLPLTSNSAGLR